METVGIRDLKNHLSEYVRRVRHGEAFGVTSNGEVVAELRPPEPLSEDFPAGLQELARLQIARRIVRNNPAVYPRFKPRLTGMTAAALLDDLRADR